MRTKQLWVTEGDEVSIDKIEDLIYRNSSVNDFLGSDNKKFIIASKGVGKTLLLRLKRKYLEERYDSSVLFIPSNTPYLDFAQDQLSMIGKNNMAILTKIQTSKLFWQYALILSIISYHFKNRNIIDFNGYETIPKWVKELFNSKQPYTPCDIFTKLVTQSNISKVLDEINSSFLEINKVFTTKINYGVHVFIDRLDQALKNTPKDYWITIQTGLLEASWDLSRKNNHVKVYCSIRQEAYYNYSSEDRNAISGSVVFIKYTVEDLINMLNKSSEYYENGKDFATLMGKGRFQHPKTGIYENIDKYIIRHTMYRPRDFVAIIGNLDRTPKFRIKYFRETVNKVATEEIAKNLFFEQKIFLNYLKEQNDREKFLSLIPHNVLDRNLILDICCKFNNRNDCVQKGCRYTDVCKHPFSELYNLGLLGIIDKDDLSKKHLRKQKFKKTEDIQTFNQNLLPDNVDYYLIHPCLNDYIKSLRTRQTTEGLAYIIPFITICSDGDWGKHEESVFMLFSRLEATQPHKVRDMIHSELKCMSKKDRHEKVKEYLVKYKDVLNLENTDGNIQQNHSNYLVKAFDNIKKQHKSDQP